MLDSTEPSPYTSATAAITCGDYTARWLTNYLVVFCKPKYYNSPLRRQAFSGVGVEILNRIILSVWALAVKDLRSGVSWPCVNWSLVLLHCESGRDTRAAVAVCRLLFDVFKKTSSKTCLCIHKLALWRRIAVTIIFIYLVNVVLCRSGLLQFLTDKAWGFNLFKTYRKGDQLKSLILAQNERWRHA